MKTFLTILIMSILGLTCFIPEIGHTEVRDLKTLNRELDPFEVPCEKLADDTLVVNGIFTGTSINQIFAFAYYADKNKWEQIPLQIDQRKTDYDYIFIKGELDTILSGYDQIAVMLKDLGDQVSENTWIPDLDSRNYARYEIRARVQDPDDPTYEYWGWFYLYRSQTYQDTVTTDYVDVNPQTNTIYSDIYTIGHNNRGVMDHISFPATRGTRGATEIIDRQKVRLRGEANYYGIKKEYNDTEDELNLDDASYIDGKVRVLQRFQWHIKKSIGFIDLEIPFDLTKKYYQHLLEIGGRATIGPEFGCDLLRISIDIHPQIAGAKFYNQYNDGLTLNRVANEVVNKRIDIPGTFWALVTSQYGSFLQLLTVDQKIGDIQELYYCERNYGTADYDDNFTKTKDTGDMNSWGDIGVKVRGNVRGQANLATNLVLFQEQIDKATGALLAQNYGAPANWWGGIIAQNFDGIAPIAVILEIKNQGDDFVEIAWKAPGDDGNSGGPAALYEMRFSSKQPTFDPEIWWTLAKPVENLPQPAEPDSEQSVIISNLALETTYFFGMRTKDDAGNWSKLSGIIGTTTLPVELAGFEYNLQESGVQLTWKTLSETNNYGFEIERKNGNGSFESIAFVEGAGTTNLPQQYSFLDPVNAVGTFYYRLKQIDTNGEFEYSSLIQVDLLGPRDFALHQNYPNPFNAETTISFTLKGISSGAAVESAFEVEVIIYNVLGQKIRTLATEEMAIGPHQLKWNGQDDFGQSVAGGVYFYRLSVKSLVDGREVWSKMKKMILMP